MGSGNIRIIYIDKLANRGMNLGFVKAVLEYSHWKWNKHFGIPSLNARDSVLTLESSSIGGQRS